MKRSARSSAATSSASPAKRRAGGPPAQAPHHATPAYSCQRHVLYAAAQLTLATSSSRATARRDHGPEARATLVSPPAQAPHHAKPAYSYQRHVLYAAAQLTLATSSSRATARRCHGPEARATLARRPACSSTSPRHTCLHLPTPCATRCCAAHSGHIILSGHSAA